MNETKAAEPRLTPEVMEQNLMGKLQAILEQLNRLNEERLRIEGELRLLKLLKDRNLLAEEKRIVQPAMAIPKKPQ